jgi:hypothetical protein
MAGLQGYHNDKKWNTHTTGIDMIKQIDGTIYIYIM